MTDTPPKRVECTECHFTRIVDEDDELPADVVIEHGRETGHVLTITPIEEDEERPSP